MTDVADTDLDAFLAAAWNDHAGSAEEVAERLATSFHRVRQVGHVAPYARLLAHVHGEHLGRWQRGAELLDALRALPLLAAAPDAARPLLAQAAALRHAGGDDSAIDALDPPGRALALAVAAAALAGRDDFGRATAAFASALAIGDAGLPDGDPAIRAIAVAGNNLAAALESKGDRDGAETRAMVEAARAALAWWTRAGTWLEVERAEYRLACSLIAAGAPEEASAHAMRCVALCDAHDASPFERFFAHAAMATAHRRAGRDGLFEVHRALARERATQLAPEDRLACQDDLDALGR